MSSSSPPKAASDAALNKASKAAPKIGPKATALQNSLKQLVHQAALSSHSHTQPAIENLSLSQPPLEAQLRTLDEEMGRITSTLETVTLDPETSARMEDTRECLKRTKRKLTTIRGRLGRLRAVEESDGLMLMQRSMVDMGGEKKR